MDCAATAALPVADSGRMRPTLTLPVPILGDAGGGALVDVPAPRSPIPEQPASRRRDAKTASHGEEARTGREFQACNARNMGPASAATAHHVAASACLQSHFGGERLTECKG